MGKGALETMTLTLAGALGARGITVNAVAPGATRTDVNVAVFEAPGTEEFITGQTALNRLGRAEDIADVVAFPRSDERPLITGQVLDASAASTSASGPDAPPPNLRTLAQHRAKRASLGSSETRSSEGGSDGEGTGRIGGREWAHWRVRRGPPGPRSGKLGGIVLAAAGATAAQQWRQQAGGRAAGALTVAYVAAFAGSHPLARRSAPGRRVRRRRGHRLASWAVADRRAA